MAKMKSKPPTLYMTVDPAIAKPCWIAYSKPFQGDIVEIQSEWLTDVGKFLMIWGGWFGTETTPMQPTRIVAAIEKPTVGKREYGLAMIFAANAISGAIKRIAPNPSGSIKNTWRNKIFFVDPNIWQAAMLTGAPGANTKEQSCWVASQIAKREITNDNEADAICLFAYAESLDWEL